MCVAVLVNEAKQKKSQSKTWGQTKRKKWVFPLFSVVASIAILFIAVEWYYLLLTEMK